MEVDATLLTERASLSHCVELQTLLEVSGYSRESENHSNLSSNIGAGVHKHKAALDLQC